VISKTAGNEEIRRCLHSSRSARTWRSAARAPRQSVPHGRFFWTEYSPFLITDPAGCGVGGPASGRLAVPVSKAGGRLYEHISETAATLLRVRPATSSWESILKAMDCCRSPVYLTLGKSLRYLSLEPRRSLDAYNTGRFRPGVACWRAAWWRPWARYVEVTRRVHSVRYWICPSDGHERLAMMKKVIDARRGQPLIPSISKRGLPEPYAGRAGRANSDAMPFTEGKVGKEVATSPLPRT